MSKLRHVESEITTRQGLRRCLSPKPVPSSLYYIQSYFGSCSYLLSRHYNHWVSGYWIITPRGNTGLGSWEPLVVTFSSTKQYTALLRLCVCVFLFKDILFNIHCWFVDYKIMANRTITHAERSLSNLYFLHKACHSLLALRNARQYFSTRLSKEQNH